MAPEPVRKTTTYTLICPLCKKEIVLSAFQWKIKCSNCGTVHECYLKNS